VNQRLVVCMFASVAVAAVSASLVLGAGWGWFPAFLVYSLGGSLALVGFALAASIAEDAAMQAKALRRRPAVPAWAAIRARSG
jgi:sulfite exporter TauE/SafE